MYYENSILNFFHESLIGHTFVNCVIESVDTLYKECSFIACTKVKLGECDDVRDCVFIDCDPHEWESPEKEYKYSINGVNDCRKPYLHNPQNDLSYFEKQSKKLLAR